MLRLFSWSAGTGKTFAAEIHATRLAENQNHLGLCALVTKYIGETERNQRRVIAAAKPIEVVFLFDEAGAPFGKRTEVCGACNPYTSMNADYKPRQIVNHRGFVVLAVLPF